jgi:hydroxyacylglutathione hydrolase
MSKRKFVLVLMQDQPQSPQYFSYDAALNKRKRSTLDQTINRVMVSLTLDEVLAHQSAGAQVLDVRDPAGYESAHVTGAINVWYRRYLCALGGSGTESNQAHHCDY